MVNCLFPNLQQRNCSDKEKLELAEVDPGLLRRTIRQFRLINSLLSGSQRLMEEHFFTIMQRNPERSYTLLDVGAGGCDIAIRAVRRARRRGLKLNITALDNDTRTLPLAHQAVRDYPEITIVEGNALELTPLGSFDFVFSNHLLHHLSGEQIRTFLRQAVAQTRLALVMNDVKRSRWAYLGFTVFSAVCTPRSYHFHDGRLSIARGFRPAELRDLLSDFQAVEVMERFPARVALIHVKRCAATGEQSAGS
jgi:2-polyprenyl-3-methyl-5-hydroxy-6-metoxy-1,4-benzoquinol methylase